MATLKETCDAIVADLEANAGLPAHRTWKYVEPTTMRADRAPWLAVWPVKSHVNPLVSADHGSGDLFAIVWATSALKAVEGEASVQAAHDLDTADAVVTRAESWLTAAGVPGTGHCAAVKQVTYVVKDQMWQAVCLVEVERL